MNDEFHDTRDQRASVAQAAQMLGISEGAVRKRVERGKLRAEHDNAGRLIVYLDATTTDATHDTTHDRPRQSRGDRYTRSLEDQVEYLRRQLDQERNSSAELRQAIIRLAQANAEQANTIQAIEAPAIQEEPPDDAETVEDEPEGAEPRSAEGEAQEELSAERARREMAETTLHEGMTEERRRREAAERERDELRQALVGRGRRTEAHEAAERQQGRGQPQSATGEAQEGTRRPWWRRMLGR